MTRSPCLLLPLPCGGRRRAVRDPNLRSPLLDHQGVLLERGCARVSMAVLTMFDGSHQYGKDTLKGIFQRLLHGFPKGRTSRRHH